MADTHNTFPLIRHGEQNLETIAEGQNFWGANLIN